jgi:hypothetical protein
MPNLSAIYCSECHILHAQHNIVSSRPNNTMCFEGKAKGLFSGSSECRILPIIIVIFNQAKAAPVGRPTGSRRIGTFFRHWDELRRSVFLKNGRYGNILLPAVCSDRRFYQCNGVFRCPIRNEYPRHRRNSYSFSCRTEGSRSAPSHRGGRNIPSDLNSYRKPRDPHRVFLRVPQNRRSSKWRRQKIPRLTHAASLSYSQKTINLRNNQSHPFPLVPAPAA